MKTADFNYHLPPNLIAQTPAEPRDSSRLLVLDRETGDITHRHFRDLGDYLVPGDILVANDSRVIPARLYGRKEHSGGRVELLLLKRLDNTRWQALVGGKRLVAGSVILIDEPDGPAGHTIATITAVGDGAQREVTFNRPIDDALTRLGHTPLPPYIQTQLADPERYQTVYARPAGSAAAPTAGLHFTGEMLLALRERKVRFETGTLHVGLDTFQPVTATAVADHVIHSEWAALTPDAARRINEAKLAGGRVVAVGTTAVRLLETAAHRSAGNSRSLQDASRLPPPGYCPWKPVAAFEGPTDLFIYPGYTFRVVDALLTNFHLPQSSLLMLVAALVGREKMFEAYETAVREKYRFYSFGDAMLIL